MRKNASSLMDIYYKKSEFLVEGLKNSVQIAQMKEKVEAAQALQLAKDELKVSKYSKLEINSIFLARPTKAIIIGC